MSILVTGYVMHWCPVRLPYWLYLPDLAVAMRQDSPSRLLDIYI